MKRALSPPVPHRRRARRSPPQPSKKSPRPRPRHPPRSPAAGVSREVEITGCRMLDASGAERYAFRSGESVTIEIAVSPRGPDFRLRLRRRHLHARGRLRARDEHGDRRLPARRASTAPPPRASRSPRSTSGRARTSWTSPSTRGARRRTTTGAARAASRSTRPTGAPASTVRSGAGRSWGRSRSGTRERRHEPPPAAGRGGEDAPRPPPPRDPSPRPRARARASLRARRGPLRRDPARDARDGRLDHAAPERGPLLREAAALLLVRRGVDGGPRSDGARGAPPRQALGGGHGPPRGRVRAAAVRRARRAPRGPRPRVLAPRRRARAHRDHRPDALARAVAARLSLSPPSRRPTSRAIAKRARRALYGFHVACAAAVLLKGLIGVVLPGGAIVFWTLLTGRVADASPGVLAGTAPRLPRPRRPVARRGGATASGFPPVLFRARALRPLREDGAQADGPRRVLRPGPPRGIPAVDGVPRALEGDVAGPHALRPGRRARPRASCGCSRASSSSSSPSRAPS